MGLRSEGRKLSFEILDGIDDNSDLIQSQTSLSPSCSGSHEFKIKKKRKHRTSKKKNEISAVDQSSIPEDTIADQQSLSTAANGFEINSNSYEGTVVLEEQIRVPEQSQERVCMVADAPEIEFESVWWSDGRGNFGEWRPRNAVKDGRVEQSGVDMIGIDRCNSEKFIKRDYVDNGSAEQFAKSGFDLGGGDGFKFEQLRLRDPVKNGSVEGSAPPGGNDDNDLKNNVTFEVNSTDKRSNEPNGNVILRLETSESLDWKRLMEEDLNYKFSVDKSPVKHFLEEICGANSLQSTLALGNEEERERVYDTIFRLPWRCELLIDVGFFVCFNSFLSLLTVMPMRILMTMCRLLKTRQFRRPSAVELSDFGCFVIMAFGVTLLQQTDISLIYHIIRGQSTIKLYVVYNVLEIFDKLCQNFVGDVMQTLFHSADGLANSSSENLKSQIQAFISDEMLAVATSIVHSFILLAQAITLSTCIVAHNNALFALLVSNNFAEIKSNVFKRFSKDNIHHMVYFDSVERFHITAFIIFVLAQNILEAEGPWFNSFMLNTLLVFICEMIIDIIKHSFIAKFNDIKPIAYSEFLEDLCKQTLNTQTEDPKKNLTFVPLAPTCVIIRVLTPVYAAHLPYNPLPWRMFWMLIFLATTYIMLVSIKILISIGLQKHATWYVNRCRRRRNHLHLD